MSLSRYLDKEAVKRFITAYKTSEVVFWEGEAANQFFIIMEGSIEIRRRRPSDGNSFVIAELKNGDFFGEMALISNLPRTGTAMAKERTRLLVLSKDQLMQLLSQDSGFAMLMIQRLCQRLKTLGDILVDI